MGVFTQSGAALEWHGGHETVRIEPWGRDSLRVRGTVWQGIRDDLPGALLDQPPGRRRGRDLGRPGPDRQRRTDRRDLRLGTDPVPSRGRPGAAVRDHAALHRAADPAVLDRRRRHAPLRGAVQLPRRGALLRARPAPARPAATRRARSSSSSSATPRSPSRSWSRTGATACCGTTRGSAGSSWAPRSRGGSPKPPASGTTGSPPPASPRICSAPTARRSGGRRCSRTGRPASGSASSATRPRTNCSASRASTSGAACRCR